VRMDKGMWADEETKAHPTKFYTSGKPFPLFHRLEVYEEEEDHSSDMNDFEMSVNPSFDEGQEAGSHSDAGVQFSTVAQGKHVQVLADAISGVSEKFKVDEKLGQLGFSDDEV
ncbi:hypothetical protein HN873_036786, partial [Arachis hypogaea]